MIVRNKQRRVRFGLTTKIRRGNEAYGDWSLERSVAVTRDRQCTNCGSNNRLQVHHIIPIASGGKTIQANLTTLCASCHKYKHRHIK